MDIVKMLGRIGLATATACSAPTPAPPFCSTGLGCEHLVDKAFLGPNGEVFLVFDDPLAWQKDVSCVLAYHQALGAPAESQESTKSALEPGLYHTSTEFDLDNWASALGGEDPRDVFREAYSFGRATITQVARDAGVSLIDDAYWQAVSSNNPIEILLHSGAPIVGEGQLEIPVLDMNLQMNPCVQGFNVVSYPPGGVAQPGDPDSVTFHWYNVAFLPVGSGTTKILGRRYRVDWDPPTRLKLVVTNELGNYIAEFLSNSSDSEVRKTYDQMVKYLFELYNVNLDPKEMEQQLINEIFSTLCEIYASASFSDEQSEYSPAEINERVMQIVRNYNLAQNTVSGEPSGVEEGTKREMARYARHCKLQEERLTTIEKRARAEQRNLTREEIVLLERIERKLYGIALKRDSKTGQRVCTFDSIGVDIQRRAIGRTDFNLEDYLANLVAGGYITEEEAGTLWATYGNDLVMYQPEGINS